MAATTTASGINPAHDDSLQREFFKLKAWTPNPPPHPSRSQPTPLIPTASRETRDTKQLSALGEDDRHFGRADGHPSTAVGLLTLGLKRAST